MINTFLRCRTALRAMIAASTVLLVAGCVAPYESKEIAVLAVDTETGMPVPGVRIFRHVDEPALLNSPDDAVANTDDDGVAAFKAPRLHAKWLVTCDGYEPRLVDFRSRVAAEPEGRFETALVWSDITDEGELELEMTPMIQRTVDFKVVDADTGSPISGAEIVQSSTSFFNRELDQRLFGVPVAISTVTAADGRVTLSMPSCLKTEVSIEAIGHAGTATIFDPESHAGVSSRREVALQPYQYEPMRILVMDRETGLGVAGAVVRVRLNDPRTGEFRSDSLWDTGEDGTVVVMKPTAGLGSISVEVGNRLASEFRVIEIRASEFMPVAIGFDDPDFD